MKFNSQIQASEELCELMGIIIGDGCISVNNRYSEIAIAGDINEEQEYYDTHIIPLFNSCLGIPIMGKEFKGKAYPSVGTYGIYVFNKPIVDFLLSLGLKSGSKINVQIPKWILRDKAYTRAFLRGLFDTDGSVYFQKNYSAKKSKHIAHRISLGSTSKPLVEQVKQVLETLGFHPMTKKPYRGRRDKNTVYGLVIHRKADFQRWLTEIGFSSPKHQTKIEVWKKLGYKQTKTTLQERRNILGILHKCN